MEIRNPIASDIVTDVEGHTHYVDPNTRPFIERPWPADRQPRDCT